MSEAAKKKIKEALTGMKLSEETKSIISQRKQDINTLRNLNRE